jgi:hypothetical protein
MRMGPKTIWRLLKATFWQWYEDNTFLHGAALAFYTAFAIAPVVIIAVSVAGLVFGQGGRPEGDGARDQQRRRHADRRDRPQYCARHADGRIRRGHDGR